MTPGVTAGAPVGPLWTPVAPRYQVPAPMGWDRLGWGVFTKMLLNRVQMAPNGEVGFHEEAHECM